MPTTCGLWPHTTDISTFLDARDVGLDIGDLGDAMLDHKVSRKIVDDFSIVDRPK